MTTVNDETACNARHRSSGSPASPTQGLLRVRVMKGPHHGLRSRRFRMMVNPWKALRDCHLRKRLDGIAIRVLLLAAHEPNPSSTAIQADPKMSKPRRYPKWRGPLKSWCLSELRLQNPALPGLRLVQTRGGIRRPASLTVTRIPCPETKFSINPPLHLCTVGTLS